MPELDSSAITIHIQIQFQISQKSGKINKNFKIPYFCQNLTEISQKLIGHLLLSPNNYTKYEGFSGRASDSESIGPGFDPHKRHRVVSLSKIH